ncbi:hypothetical protein CsSME_00005513 [Camellia sinensis var. sinensis]
MKSMSNDNNTNTNTNNSNNNWLGFSLSSSHMNTIGVSSEPHHQTHISLSGSVSSALPTSFFHSPSHFSYSGACYGVHEAENGAFYSPLTVMPLKSDGSLCIMEALTRSQTPQGMETTSTPKLEDFFGGATMGTHHYESCDREAMALSLDSLYYHQQQNPDHETNNNNTSQDFLNHQPQNQIHVQQYSDYSAFRGHEVYQTSPLTEDTKQAQITTMAAEDEICGMKNWVSRNFHGSHGLGDNGGESGSMSALGYGDLQSLSLSMSPGSQSSCVTGSHQISPAVTECVALETKKRGSVKLDQKQTVHRKSIDTFGQRTSQYRGVTRHRWTGRYEAHLWDNSCKKEGQSRKGRQVYLGGYDVEEKAARAYDLAALKYWGASTHINFPVENYQQELEDMKNMTRQEYVAHLRRKSSGFSRGASMYRGVTRHHQHGRWQARIGRVAGNKDLYLGTFSTQEEAAEAYDIAAIKFRGVNAVTNFDISRYDVERIMASNTLLAGELARRNKEIESIKEVPNQDLLTLNHTVEATLPKESDGSKSNWEMTLYQHQRQDDGIENCKNNPSFSMASDHDLVGNRMIGLDQQEVDESGKMANHLSNASSLVTSLASSREGSPDKQNGLPLLFTMPPSSASAKFANSSTSAVNSWMSSTQLRPPMSLPHVPVFAAWTDAS